MDVLAGDVHRDGVRASMAGGVARPVVGYLLLLPLRPQDRGG